MGVMQTMWELLNVFEKPLFTFKNRYIFQ